MEEKERVYKWEFGNTQYFNSIWDRIVFLFKGKIYTDITYDEKGWITVTIDVRKLNQDN